MKFPKKIDFEIFKIIFLQEKKVFFDSDFFSVLEIISRIDCTQKIHYIQRLDHYILTIYNFSFGACGCQITIFIYAYTHGMCICIFSRKKCVYALLCICTFERFSRCVYALLRDFRDVCIMCICTFPRKKCVYALLRISWSDLRWSRLLTKTPLKSR